MKTILTILMVLILSGCSTTYRVGEAVYGAGETIVPIVVKDEGTLRRLDKVDTVVKAVDEAKTTIEEIVEEKK